jgi:NodT family efflux transporter outer membrane factor (OMF) lipoprotein
VKRAAASVAVLLAGCTTVGPNYRQPVVAVPPHYQEAAASSAGDAELAAWWRGFGDPQLSALIDLALVQNLDIQSAAARIREARAMERAAGAAGLPQVDAQASAARQRISEHAIPVPPGSGGGGAFGLPGSEFNIFRAGFDAAWELDLFGRTRRSIEAANARAGATMWDRRDVEVSVAAEVAAAYFRLRTAQAQRANAEAELGRQQRLERLLAAQARGGLITGQELATQSAARAAAAAAIPTLEAQARTEIHALGVLVGSTPEALTAQLAPAAAIPTAPTIPAGLPSDLLRRRPDVRAAERELAAATADIGVAVADLYPRISLTAAPALVSTALASLIEWGSRSFSAGAALDWPLFDGGRRRATVEAKNARQEQAMIAYRKTVLGALRDVEDALSRIEADRVQLAEQQEAARNAARAEQLSNTRYRGGLVTYADVLAQQAQRLSMEKQVVEIKGALARDTASLAKALGGGWPELAQGGAQ